MTSWPASRVASLRVETPGCANRIHFNNAGAGLMPQPVIDSIKDHIDLEARIGGYEAAHARAHEIEEAYRAVADLVSAAPRNVAFVENATVAYAQVLSSIPFERGDVVVTTTNDYISNQLMFLSLHKRLGVEVVRTPNTAAGEVDVAGLRSSLARKRPRLVAVTHVPTNSGLVQPIEAIGTVCREFETLYLVDGCQSVGQRAIDVGAIGCDFFSATSRKFLRGPRGAGFLFASDRVLELGLEPLLVDMRGALWIAPDEYALVPSARRFENWEFAYALVLGTGAAAKYAQRVGVEDIAERTTALGEQLRERATAEGLRVLDHGADRCAIVTLQIPGWRPGAFHAELEARGINSTVSTRAYAVIDFDAKGVEWAIRLSPHYYNTEDEVNEVVEAVAELVRKSRD